MYQKRNFSEKMAEYRQSINDISEAIIKQMEQSDDNWVMPWSNGFQQAVNAFTGKQYRGNNMMILWNKCLHENYPDNKWATLYQWARKGAKVKRGEKSTLVCFAIPVDKKKIKGEIQLNLFEPLNLKELNEKNVHFKFKFINVFNASQIKGYAPNHPDLFNPEKSSNELIEMLIDKSKAKIIYGGDSAYYNIHSDEITIPQIIQFKDTSTGTKLENYHSTIIHELIHWTGHNSRCKRSLINAFGSPAYAFEELIAELGSALLCTQIKHKTTPQLNHAKYINSWIKVLKNDFSYFTEALELARTAIFYLNNLTGIYPNLKPQQEREVNEKSVSKIEEILGK